MSNEKQEKKKENLASEFELSGKEQYVKLSDGSEIRVLSFEHLEEAAEEIEILFVAGMLTIFPRWEKVIKELNTNYKVHYVESREKYTSRLTKRASMKIADRMAKDIAEVEEFLGLDKRQYLTISSSLGGAVILENLAQKAITPLGAILVGPGTELHFPKGLPFLMRFIPPFIITMFKPAIRWYFRNILVDSKKEPEQARVYIRSLNEADIRKMRKCVVQNARYKGWDILPNVQGRSVLIGATLDKVHKSDFTLRVARAMPNCTFVDLGSNKAAHDTPLVNLIKDFMKELSGKGPRIGINPKEITLEDLVAKK